MRTIKLDNDDKKYQFSTLKFNMIYDNWNIEEHEGLTMQKYLEKHLFLDKNCFYNYMHGRNGMEKSNIEKFVGLIGIAITDLLEEKKDNKKEKKELRDIAHAIKYSTLSDFSKSKIFETITCIEECIWAFFATFDVEEEYFEVLESLRRNAVAIPDEILNELESFVYCELDDLISNPDAVFEQLPPISETIEGTKARNKKLFEIQDSFMEESFLPLQKHIKEFIVR